MPDRRRPHPLIAPSQPGLSCALAQGRGQGLWRIAAMSGHDVGMGSPSDFADNEHSVRLHDHRPIVVGTDGSPESERGVRYAEALAATLGSDLVVVHALGLLSKGVDWHASHEERQRWAEEQLDGPWTAFLEHTSTHDAGRVRTRVVDGPDATGLLRVADEEDAAMIVVGSHGSGGSGDPFLGSTSHRTVKDSHRPVVVVPPGDDHEHRRSPSITTTD